MVGALSEPSNLLLFVEVCPVSGAGLIGAVSRAGEVGVVAVTRDVGAVPSGGQITAVFGAGEIRDDGDLANTGYPDPRRWVGDTFAAEQEPQRPPPPRLRNMWWNRDDDLRWYRLPGACTCPWLEQSPPGGLLRWQRGERDNDLRDRLRLPCLNSGLEQSTSCRLLWW